MSVTKIKQAVLSAFRKYPSASNCVVFGSLYVTAEFTQQTLLRKYFPKQQGGKSEDYDFETLKRYGLLGTFVFPNIMNVFYRWLDGRYVGTNPRIVLKKMALDQMLLTPTSLTAFFVGMSWLEGKQDLTLELKQKFGSTYLTSFFFWIPAQALNFGFVPAPARVVYMGCATFFWANILCYIKRDIT